MTKAARVITIVAAGKTNNAASGQLEFRHPPPLSLYVHIPWCVQKCPYCDFNSHQARGEIPEADYVGALIADLESSLPLIWGRQVSSIFFGGGTPSLLSGQAIDTLLTAIRTLLPLAPDAALFVFPAATIVMTRADLDISARLAAVRAAAPAPVRGASGGFSRRPRVLPRSGRAREYRTAGRSQNPRCRARR